MIIYAVHGTWPYGRPTWRGRRRTRADWVGPERPWFDKDSSFAKAVIQGRDVTWVPFEWCGDNTFTARDEAIKKLHACLCTSLAESGVPHAIVAHSHGGTVALAAFAKLQAKEQARIAGIVTMGTPFVTLRYAATPTFGVARALLERAGGILPIVVVVAAAAVWAFGSDRLSHTLGFSALAWLAILAALATTLSRLIEARTGLSRPHFDLFKGLKSRNPPLVALRAPGDEASLAISSAQALRLAALAALRMFPFSVDKQLRVPAWVPKMCLVVFALWMSGALVQGVATNWSTLQSAAWWDIPTAARASSALGVAVVSAATGVSILVVLALAFSTALLACLATASAVALSHATGREAWDLIAEVECEPVPSGVGAVLETLALDRSEEITIAGGAIMRHSFHELPTARDRVAEIIGDWLAPAGDEGRALAEGGRARRLVIDRWLDTHAGIIRAGGAEARQIVQHLKDLTLTSAGPVAAYQVLNCLRPLLPESDRGALDAQLIDVALSEVGGGLVDVKRELNEL